MTQFKKSDDWSLVVGSGISRGICPDWEELAFKLVKAVVNSKLTQDEWVKGKGKFPQSLDGWIQCAYNAISIKCKDRRIADQSFYDLLEMSLYEDFLSKARSNGVEKHISKYLSLPFTLDGNYVKCLDFLDNNYEKNGNAILSKFLVDAAKANRGPKAVLTFNADTILAMMVRLEEFRVGVDPTIKPMNAPPMLYKRSLRTIEDPIGAIPIIHLHGSIFPKGRIQDSRESLIFLESSFHDVSGSVGNWAQTFFCNAALQSKIIFYGVSMTDPNIRRWLTWTTSIQNAEISKHQSAHSPIRKHVWITSDPGNSIVRDIISKSVVHLGIKVEFIDDWKNGGEKLREIVL